MTANESTMARLDGGKLNLDKRRQTHFFKQTASIAQAALGAALGAGGMNGMDAANLMAGFATAALNSNGGGGGSGRGGGGGLFERGASWATSRLGALVGGGAPHQNQQQPGEGSPGGAFDGAAGGGNRPGAYSRGGGLLSLLTPSGGAAALSVSPSYCRAKLLLLSAPWLRRWPYSRVREPQSVASTGGPTIYAPPARDVHAPDLYIPAMALATLAVLRGAAEVFSTHESASAPSSLAALSRGNQGVSTAPPSRPRCGPWGRAPRPQSRSPSWRPTRGTPCSTAPPSAPSEGPRRSLPPLPLRTPRQLPPRSRLRWRRRTLS